MEGYGLDARCSMLIEEYRDNLPVFSVMNRVVREQLEKIISDNNIYITALETRIKAEPSLAGKLLLKGHKYQSLSDLTDIIGGRIITFYSDEVDKIAAIVDRVFSVDWANSVDKRRQHELDSFGYNSLHYICRIPKELYYDPQMPMINEFRFELQMRTALQHVWATMNHDIGYKSGVEVPHEYLRNLNRLAGMLELADEQFSRIRADINDYRRNVQTLVASGRFDEIPLDGDTFRSYLDLGLFNGLVKKIASINQAEIQETSAMPYLKVLKALEINTVGDLENIRRKYTDLAFSFAAYQLANTDIDIISSTVALHDILVVYIIDSGYGVKNLEYMFDLLYGPQPYNEARARRLMEISSQLPFSHK